MLLEENLLKRRNGGKQNAERRRLESSTAERRKQESKMEEPSMMKRKILTKIFKSAEKPEEKIINGKHFMQKNLIIIDIYNDWKRSFQKVNCNCNRKQKTKNFLQSHNVFQLFCIPAVSCIPFCFTAFSFSPSTEGGKC